MKYKQRKRVTTMIQNYVVIKISLCLALLIIIGCNRENKYEKIKRSNITVVPIVNNIKLKHLEIDTIFIHTDNFSGKGFFDFSTDSVILFDEIYATATTFSFDGKNGHQHLGLGNAPTEIRGFQNYVYHNKKHIFFNSIFIYTYNEHWSLDNIKTITFDVKHSEKELFKNPRPDYQGIYEIKYFQNQISFINDSMFLINIESSHPKFNFLSHKKYYEESRIFAKVNYNTELVTEILGYHSNEYLKYNYIPAFDYYHYDIKDGLIYINFEPDSLIYVYDTAFHLIKAFGVGGKIKNKNYIETTTYQEYYNKAIDESASKGYYSYIYLFPDNKHIFRCYKTGEEADFNPSRMQIFINDTLIGDLPTPVRFKNIVYKFPYYYADGFFDPDNNIIGFYRFKL